MQSSRGCKSRTSFLSFAVSPSQTSFTCSSSGIRMSLCILGSDSNVATAKWHSIAFNIGAHTRRPNTACDTTLVVSVVPFTRKGHHICHTAIIVTNEKFKLKKVTKNFKNPKKVF